MESINGYINPFSDRFKQATQEFAALSGFEQFVTVSFTIITGLGTLFLGGIGGFATFRALVDKFKIKKINSSHDKTTHIANGIGTRTLTTSSTKSSLVFKEDISTPQPTKIYKKSNGTNRTGFICITTQTGGYIGLPSQQILLPPYLAKKEGSASPVFTTEEGRPLPLNPNDFLVEIHLYDSSIGNDIPSTFFLPAALFKGKKDGDSLKLKYNDSLIELTINQQYHGLKFAKGTFEEVFKLQKAYIKEQCDIEQPFFANYDPYWGYSVGEKGTIFGFKNGDNTLVLEEKNADSFRPKVDPQRARMDILQSKDETKLMFVLEFTGFDSSDIDIIINEKHLVFYAKNKVPLFDSPEKFDNVFVENMVGDEDMWKAVFGDRELIAMFRWDKLDCFKDLTVEKMRAKLSEGEFLFDKGFLTIRIHK
jgi:hypothetical protein